MNRFRPNPAGGLIFIGFGLGYMVITLPDETASAATAIRWAGLGLAFLLCGIIVVLTNILAAIKRSKNETHASGGGTRLRDDRPNEPVEP